MYSKITEFYKYKYGRIKELYKYGYFMIWKSHGYGYVIIKELDEHIKQTHFMDLQ